MVRQGAKRRTTPSVLTPLEIKALINNLGSRDRTLILVVASTGLRQSELFGLKWGDINCDQGTMSVTRLIVCGVVGACKTESSQKPVPVHPTVLEAVVKWKEACHYIGADDWVFASIRHRGRKPIWDQAILRKYIRPVAARRDSETVWMAYVPAHILDSAAKRRYRVQGDAGTVETFLVTIHVGCLHASDLARKICAAGSSARPGIRS